MSFFCATALFLDAQALGGAQYDSCIASSGSNGDIEAQRQACEYCDGGSSRGALWFNDSASDPFKSYVSIDDPNTPTVTVYLRGNVYSCGTSQSARLEAWDIRFVKSPVSTETSSFDLETSITGLSADRLYRGDGAGRPYAWNNANGGASATVTATLNVANFKAGASSCGDNCFQKDIHVYRCYVSGGVQTHGTGCYSSPVSVMLQFSPSLVPESQISNNGSNYVKRDIFVKPGDTVYFQHNYRKTGLGGKIPDCSWWIYQSSQNGATPANSLSPGIPTDSSPSSSDCRDENIVPNEGYLLKTNLGTRVIVKFKVPDNARTGWRWCQRAAYRNQSSGGIVDDVYNHQAEPRVCAEVKDGGGDPPPCEETGTCPQSCPLPDSSHSIRYGGTQARSGVVNLTKDGKWAYTDGATSTPAFVWARPGDTVKFQHTLCFGAQNVRGSKDNGVSTTLPSDDVIPSTANTATVTALTAPDTSDGKYLFGNALNGGSTQTFTVSPGNASADSGTPDEKGDYWFTYYSPSNNSASTYSCYATDRGFPQFKANGYQIPDFTSTTVPANCNSAKKASTSSDAGKIIEQNLTWNDVKAWQNTHKTDSGGSCSCNTRDAYADNVTHSYEDMKNGSVSPGTNVRKCYQTSPTGCGWCNRSPSYGTRDYYYYPIDTLPSEGKKQIAQVKIPYNYTTTATVKTTDKPEVFSGGDLPVQVTVDVNPRSNPGVSSGEYATISKGSVYQIIAFTVDAGRSAGSIEHGGNVKSWGGSGTDICNRARGNVCRTVARSSKTFNEEGNLFGDSDPVFSGDLAIPDAEVGTKFCVAVGVWPSDSHNFGSEPAGAAETALKNGTGAYWNYSEPNCRTISKKPMVQFWGSGIYSTGGITTSQTKKTVGYAIYGRSGTGLYSGSVSYGGDPAGTRRVFGSFSEYDAIVSGNDKLIDGFASGAAFGYRPNNRGYLPGALPGGYPGVGIDVEANVCTYSTQSFSNDKCSEKVVGAATINSFGATILERLLSRYTDKSGEATLAENSTINFSGGYRVLENGTKYIKVRGNANMAGYCMPKSTNTARSNTVVVDVSGTLEINGNIQYGAGCADETYRSIAELPQIIISAGDIKIAGGVTRIDAWLIAGQNGTGNGEIKTCSDVAEQIGKLGNSYKSGGVITVGVNHCSNQLRVNGPVFAKKLILNRNAGAGTGNASIQAAEIFNLRPDTYLWAYNQASRYSQAVTTYQRELAPRY